MALLGGALLTAACSSEGQTANPSGASIAPAAHGESTPTASVTSIEVSVDAAAVIEAADLSLSPEQESCLGGRLDEDDALRSALGEDPEHSDQFEDLMGLVSDCIRTTTFAQ